MKLGRRLGADLAHDSYAGVLPLEIGDSLLPHLRRFRAPGDKPQLGGRSTSHVAVKAKDECQRHCDPIDSRHRAIFRDQLSEAFSAAKLL
jgi:hypothetical protein